MGKEKNNNEKGRIFDCCSCNEITEMMKGCFPDDAGYSKCLARMNGNWGKFRGRQADAAASEDGQDCCG